MCNGDLSGLAKEKFSGSPNLYGKIKSNKIKMMYHKRLILSFTI
jgi:hypothetical protein